MSESTADDDVAHLGIVLETSDPERAWNAFRLGITALEEGKDVSAFLLEEGVEAEEIADERFDVRDRREAFAGTGGELLACGICLEIRNGDGSEVCPVSTLSGLLEVVTDADRPHDRIAHAGRVAHSTAVSSASRLASRRYDAYVDSAHSRASGASVSTNARTVPLAGS